MERLKILILTDHSGHTIHNSLYSFGQAFVRHPMVSEVFIASRGLKQNEDFFASNKSVGLWANEIDESFGFDVNGECLRKNLSEVEVADFDFIWLRLPPPIDRTFLSFLTTEYSNSFIINNPKGIFETGSKSFLTNFKELCAPMKICKSIDGIVEFKSRFPIVLKPFRNYGGKGIIKIDGDQVWDNERAIQFTEFEAEICDKRIEYLAVKFLPNVKQGDKRIVVVNGVVMGASLRLPAEGSWMCNVSMGGTSHSAEVAEEEYQIVDAINPILSDMGIVMYGVDTLVDDTNKRVISEINTTSIGGLPAIAEQKQMPLVEQAADLIIKYYLEKKDDKLH